MVQIIEENPGGFLHSLVKGITGGAKAAGEFLPELMKQQQEEKKFSQKLLQDKNSIELIEKQRGMKPGELSAYTTDPVLAEKITRPANKTQASQPIDPEQLKTIKSVRNTPEFKEATPGKKYQLLTDAGVSKENAQAESDIFAKEYDTETKKFLSSHEAQKDFIQDTTNSYKAFETETKPKLMQMQSINSDEELIGPAANKFMEELGLPLGMLENPSNELYDKISQDLLKGLPDTYGSRILRVEVENFLKTIPRLMNSANGRRMIASNMLKLGEMRETMYKEMRRQQTEAIDSGKALPIDFQQRVFDQVKPQIDRINSDFVKLASIKDVPQGTVPFFDPAGNIAFVPKNMVQEAEKNQGRRIW